MNPDVLLRLVLLLLGVLAIEGACFWLLRARNRRTNDLIAELYDADKDTRVAAADELVRRGLDETAVPLFNYIGHEIDPHARYSLALAVARRQWEPARAEGVTELREWAADMLTGKGVPVFEFSPALTRLSDMGGPRRPDPLVEEAAP